MRVLELPGVFRPISDSWLLARVLHEEALAPGSRVLELCTGSGVIATSAALDGCEVTAVDVSRRAVLSAKLNARVNGVGLRALRGDLFAPVEGERFDAIVANPPYVPAEDDALPERGLRRAWDAGRDGRVLLDRICREVPEHLTAGGVVLLVHSEVCDTDLTLRLLEEGGLEADVVERHHGPFGPLMEGRRALLEEQGLIRPGQEEEEVVVVRGRRTA